MEAQPDQYSHLKAAMVSTIQRIAEGGTWRRGSISTHLKQKLVRSPSTCTAVRACQWAAAGNAGRTGRPSHMHVPACKPSVSLPRMAACKPHTHPRTSASLQALPHTFVQSAQHASLSHTHACSSLQALFLAYKCQPAPPPPPSHLHVPACKPSLPQTCDSLQSLSPHTDQVLDRSAHSARAHCVPVVVSHCADAALGIIVHVRHTGTGRRSCGIPDPH